MPVDSVVFLRLKQLSLIAQRNVRGSEEFFETSYLFSKYEKEDVDNR